MKKLFVGLLGLAMMSLTMSCGDAAQKQENTEGEMTSEEVQENRGPASFGEEISEEGSIGLTELQEKLSVADSVACTLKGTIVETCVKKGCWMTIDTGMEEDMRVRFKDYGFFVPTEGQTGKTAIMKGMAYREETSVDMLRHYAEDAGESQEYIEAITEPEIELSFIADGVLIYD